MNRAPAQSLQIAAVLAWEFWIHCRQGIARMLLFALLVPGVIYTLLRWAHPGEPLGGTGTGGALQMVFLPVIVSLLASALVPVLANPKLRYALPASGWLLVAAPMACAMATVLACYAIVALTLNALFDAGWLILVPALAAAVAIAWLQAVLWSTSNLRGLQWLVCVASFVAIVIVSAQWAPRTPLDLDIYLRNLDRWQLSLLGVWVVLATAACAAVGTAGFSWLRHGSGFDVKRIVDWLGERFYFWWGDRQTPFASPTSAQFWLEWTERGLALPLITVSLGIGAIVLALCAPMGVGDASESIFGMAGLICTPLVPIGFYWGSRSSTFEFGNFNGSRPLSDSRLAGAVLKSANVSLLVSAAIWAALVSLVALIFALRHGAPGLYHAIEQIGPAVLLARAGLIALAVWSGVGLATSLALAGQGAMKIAFALAGGGYFTLILLSLCIREPYLSPILLTYVIACLVCGLLACVTTFVACWRRKLIDARALRLAALILCGAVVAAYSSGFFLDWRSALLVSACCGLLPIPLAAAPLAVYRNRHR